MSIKTWVTPYAFVRICIYTYVYAYAIVYVPISQYRCIRQPAIGGNLHTLESVNANASKSRDTVEGTLKEP